MACEGKCEFAFRKIVKEYPASFDTVPKNAPVPQGKQPAKADLDAAKAAIRAQVPPWLKAQVTRCPGEDKGEGKSGGDGDGKKDDKPKCQCDQTDPDPTDADYASKKVVVHTFRHDFTVNGIRFRMSMDVEYQVVYVAGACEEHDE